MLLQQKVKLLAKKIIKASKKSLNFKHKLFMDLKLYYKIKF